jgi:predicted methyltransferase
MGDYDLTSLAVLPLVKNCEIWVLDVDKEVVDVINKESRGAITAVEHNLLNPLPKRLINNFDAVFMDPPYTPWGVGLFLSRAVEVLYEKGMGKILLSYGSLDMVRVLAVQDEISKHGLVIEKIISKFNKYVNARTIGGFSDLYVLSVTAKTRPVIKGTYSGKVYTHE